MDIFTIGGVIVLIILMAGYFVQRKQREHRNQLLREVGRWLEWMLQSGGKAELNQAHVWVNGTNSDNTLSMLEHCRRVWDALENPELSPVTLVVKLGEPCPDLTDEQVQEHPAVQAQLGKLCSRLGLKDGAVTCEVIQQRSPDATLLELEVPTTQAEDAPTPPHGLRLVANEGDRMAEAG